MRIVRGMITTAGVNHVVYFYNNNKTPQCLTAAFNNNLYEYHKNNDTLFLVAWTGGMRQYQTYKFNTLSNYSYINLHTNVVSINIGFIQVFSLCRELFMCSGNNIDPGFLHYGDRECVIANHALMFGAHYSINKRGNRINPLIKKYWSDEFGSIYAKNELD